LEWRWKHHWKAREVVGKQTSRDFDKYKVEEVGEMEKSRKWRK
jgi:hypothetical protein